MRDPDSCPALLRSAGHVLTVGSYHHHFLHYNFLRDNFLHVLFPIPLNKLDQTIDGFISPTLKKNMDVKLDCTCRELP